MHNASHAHKFLFVLRRRALFERTDHISTVLGDLERAVGVASEYGRFFRGAELMVRGGRESTFCLQSFNLSASI